MREASADRQKNRTAEENASGPPKVSGRRNCVGEIIPWQTSHPLYGFQPRRGGGARSCGRQRDRIVEIDRRHHDAFHCRMLARALVPVPTEIDDHRIFRRSRLKPWNRWDRNCLGPIAPCDDGRLFSIMREPPAKRFANRLASGESEALEL